ncbi:MAG: hypothetical protein ACSHXF_13425 [Aquaticitalea sp.]
MKRRIVLIGIITFGLISCNNSQQKVNELDMAKQFYQALDTSDTVKMIDLLSDRIVVRESEYDYEETFTKNRYIEWLTWDSVFDPSYKILEINQDKDIIKATISKTDKRISFLNEEPIIWNEIIRFDKHKIIKVERVNYLQFNDSIFIKNRDNLSNWIETNHPELNDFLNGQTEVVGKNYLKAIELYQNR